MAVRSSSGMKTSVVARHHDLDAGLLLEQLLQPQRDVEHELRFVDAVAVRAGIVAAVAGVDDDARDAEPELPRERELAVRVGERHRRRGERDVRRRQRAAGDGRRLHRRSAAAAVGAAVGAAGNGDGGGTARPAAIGRESTVVGEPLVGTTDGRRRRERDRRRQRRAAAAEVDDHAGTGS